MGEQLIRFYNWQGGKNENWIFILTERTSYTKYKEKYYG